MNPIAIVIEASINAVRLIRNLLVRALPAPEFVVLQISGALPERRPAPAGFLRRRSSQLFGAPFAGPPPESLEEWRERLEMLAADPRVRGAVIKISDLQAGLASLEGLRNALSRFRNAGKRLIAHLPVTDLQTYYLATAAETIVVPESAELSLHGPRTEATFLRVALDRLGILPQFHHIAEYKSAAHRFLYPEMTGPQREMLNSVLDSIFDDLVTAVAQARRLSTDDVRQAIDLGIASVSDARGRGLIDVVAFEDELPRLLAHRPGSGRGRADRPARVLPWAEARRRVRVPYRWRSLQRGAIGVVELIGTIVPGESRELPVPLPLFGQYTAGHETVARAFRLAEKARAVKAIVFHVDSGGGSAVASDLIWREVARVQHTKPVVVYMGNVAGSGGYYISCGARHVVAASTTVTGSIGVVAGKFSAQGLFARAGLHRDVLARGETGTMFSGFVVFTETQWAILQRWMEDVYARFKGRVAAGRRMAVEEVETIARGRVWTGRQALELGLVDEVGDFDAAVRKAKSLAGIPVDADVPVVTVRPPKAAAVPAASPAAWAQMMRQAAALLDERVWLLMTTEAILR